MSKYSNNEPRRKEIDDPDIDYVDILLRNCIRSRDTYLLTKQYAADLEWWIEEGSAEDGQLVAWRALCACAADRQPTKAELLVACKREAQESSYWDCDTDLKTSQRVCRESYESLVAGAYKLSDAEIAAEREHVPKYIEQLLHYRAKSKVMQMASVWERQEEQERDGRDLPDCDKDKTHLSDLFAEAQKLYEGGPTRNPWPTLREFLKSAGSVKYLITNMLAQDQLLILGGLSKSLKTSLLVDAAVSLASAKPMLGQFDVPRRVKTVLLSGESGTATLADTIRRVAKARGVKIKHLREYLMVVPELPRLTEAAALADLEQRLRAGKYEVLIIDPLYLCFPGEDAANLFVQGERLRNVNDMCKRLGVTPILCHHARKQGKGDRGQPMTLDDLAFAGFGEFARQWWLISRRDRYQYDGRHVMTLSIGGSAGHGGHYVMTADEGKPRSKWAVSIVTASQDQERRDATKQSQQREKLKAMQSAALAQLKLNGRMSATMLADACGHRGSKTFSEALANLVKQGKVKHIPYGRNGKLVQYQRVVRVKLRKIAKPRKIIKPK